MNVQLDLSGFEGLLAKLGALEEAGQQIDEVLHQGAIKIQRAAKQNIRAKDIYDTGELLRSMTVEKIPGGYAVGTNLEHGVYNEFGTGLKGDKSVPHTQRRFWRYQDKKGNWRTSHGMKARPFLRPAFLDNKEYVVKLARSRIEAIIRRRYTN
jgi:HK97 gp10 family phage protein